MEEGAKAIVVACNTATAAVAPTLRQRLAVPIIAMEPAIKPAAKQSRSGVIGVLATTQTLSSERFARLVSEHAPGVVVVSEPSPDLVALVERGMISGAKVTAAVERHVRVLLDQRADTIVLGCTHFQFLRGVVTVVAGAAIRIVDPGLAVAEELRRRLQANGLLNVGASSPPTGSSAVENCRF